MHTLVQERVTVATTNVAMTPRSIVLGPDGGAGDPTRGVAGLEELVPRGYVVYRCWVYRFIDSLLI